MNQESKKLFDTNILIYAEDNKCDLNKHNIAIKLIREELQRKDIVLSIQNLVEFSNVLNYKYGINGSEINSRISDYRNVFTILFYSLDTIQRANLIVDECGIHFFDALIAANMEENNIDTIITENEKDFEKIHWLKVINPFRTKEK